MPASPAPGQNGGDSTQRTSATAWTSANGNSDIVRDANMNMC
jgi:hypothetical protein